MFNCLVLGDYITALEYLHNGGLENVEKGEISKWMLQVNFGENECEMEIDVPVVNSIDYDTIIPMADGILYFLNPNSMEEIEIFQEFMKIIKSIRRDVKTVVMFKDSSNYIKKPINDLLSWIWSKYLFEAYISDYNTSKNQIKEILESLCESIMRGDLLINYDTAWMQIPILHAEANKMILAEKWGMAATIVEKISKIQKKFDSIDWVIYAEKAAWLYSKNGDHLQASEVIKEFNAVYSKRYRNLYVEHLITKGNRLYQEKNFTDAAKQYETAGNWARIELKDKEIVEKSLKLAIYSWIAATEIQNAFSLLEKFDHNHMIEILEEITEKIAGAADYLSSMGHNELAKTHLYLSFQTYQKAGLFESIKVLATKSTKILKRILEIQLQADDVYSAKMTLDELFNIWESFEVKQDNIDHYLLKIGELFVKERDFQKAEIMISKIEAPNLQNKLTETMMKEEERIKNENQKDQIEDLTEAVNVLIDYVKEEALQFYEMNKRIYYQADNMVEKGDYLKSAAHIKKQADWLKYIGNDMLSFDVLEKCFEHYLNGKLISKLLSEINFIPEERRKKFLKTHLSLFETKLKESTKNIPPAEFENLINEVIKLYRNHLLYEESRVMVDILIQNLNNTASNIAEKGTHEDIHEALEITYRVEKISTKYLEAKSQNFDNIYSKVINFYIKEKNLKEARSWNEKIQDKEISIKYFEIMEKIENEESGFLAQQAKEKQEIQIYADQLSQLKNLARDQKITQKNLMRMRVGLKKHYFQKCLDLLVANQPLDAAEEYCKIAVDLAKSKKYELSGISISIATLIYILLKNLKLFKIQNQQVEQGLGLSSKIFHKTFPIMVNDYLLQMIESNISSQIIPALKLFEIMALFPEEKLILETLLGGNIDFQSVISEQTKSASESIDVIPTNYRMLIDKIVANPRLNSKRRVLEMKYWDECNNHFARQAYEHASNHYLELIDEMVSRNLEELALDCIIMGFMTLLKLKTPTDVYNQYEKFNFQLNKKYETLMKSEIIILLEYFLRYLEEPQAKQMIKDICDVFVSKMHLFDWEQSFVNGLINQMFESEKRPDDKQKVEGVVSSNDFVDDDLLSQQIIMLSQQLTSLKTEYSELLAKREKMVRTYYSDIFTELKTKNFDKATAKYVKLSKRMARRNDYETSSLMILLSILTQLKQKISPNEVKDSLNKLLDSLGIVKKILIESFGIKVAFFLIDTLLANSDSIKYHLQDLLRNMPFLKEEQGLLMI
jgi:hypothetical protein